ncbi:hypothetical protein [Mesorhizobium sp. ES1-4]|uniref:hypothetical protein n=1 Tax=Mesorhizobium sp. ES1-4 TaxID=2876627 RepID=UPI001CCB90EE|nr:hypothetical protein [Mesorhizobium sp. ES1-4]MBZ9798807.1 hypothetical protein [Mesorhizobium sp. ES1-4]
MNIHEAVALVDLTKEHADRNDLLNMRMPNGKLLKDCTGAELQEIAEGLETAGRLIERMNGRL